MNPEKDRNQIDSIQNLELDELKADLHHNLTLLSQTNNSLRRRSLAQDIQKKVAECRSRGVTETELEMLGYNQVHHAQYVDGKMHRQGITGLKNHHFFTTSIRGSKIR